MAYGTVTFPAPVLSDVLAAGDDASSHSITGVNEVDATTVAANEFDVVQTLRLINIPITSSPVTLPIDGTPSPMYTLGEGASDVTLDDAGAADSKTIWFKNTTLDTNVTLNAAEGQTVEGLPAIVLLPGAAVELWAGGATSWWVIAAQGTAWSDSIRWPANPNGGVLLRDDWDGPGAYGDGWIGIVAPNGGKLGLGAGILIHSAQFPGTPAAPAGTIGNFNQALGTTAQVIEDFSGLSYGRYTVQVGGGAGPIYAPSVDFVADAGCTGPVLQAATITSDGNTIGMVYELDWDGSQSLYGDATFDTAGHGPVIVDQSDGHTYRIISTNGVLSLHLVT